jgi:hypothetical protein
MVSSRHASSTSSAVMGCTSLGILSAAAVTLSTDHLSARSRRPCCQAVAMRGSNPCLSWLKMPKSSSRRARGALRCLGWILAHARYECHGCADAQLVPLRHCTASSSICARSLCAAGRHYAPWPCTCVRHSTDRAASTAAAQGTRAAR